MDKEPQIGDTVKTPEGDGVVVARAQVPGHWIVAAGIIKGGAVWKGKDQDVKLLKSVGEKALDD